MLLRETAPTSTRKSRRSTATKTKRYARNYSREYSRLERQKAPQTLTRGNTVSRERATPRVSTTVKKVPKPLWLQALGVLSHGSAVVCYSSVAVALVMYGMTVYAPKSWTQKYSQLQELQKRERQFTFTDEMLKDELAKSATQSRSGFVTPNPEKQPIFLPETATKQIETEVTESTNPRVITPSSPIAY